MGNHFLLTFLSLILLFQNVAFGSPGEDDNENECKPDHDYLSESLSNCMIHKGTPKSYFIRRDKNSEEYKTLNYQWNTRPDLGEIHPLGILVPRQPSDIQTAVRCGKELKVKMVAKSGGHSYEKYSFGDSNSVVVDLRYMSKISVDVATITAVAGAGALIAQLYWEIWNNGQFGIPATSCVSLGVGGVTLGGGYGYWAQRHGLLLDNVIEIEMVDANGDLLLANMNENQDLFWALRGGGGGNFGIATRFTYKLFDASALRVNHIQFSYKIDHFKEIFEAFQRWNHQEKENVGYVGLAGSPDRLVLSIINANLTKEDIARIKRSFPPATASPISLATMNFIELAAETAYPGVQFPSELQNISREDVSPHDYRAKSYYTSKLLTDEDLTLLAPLLTKIPKNCFVQFSSYGGAVNKVQKDATAFVHRDSMYNIQVGLSTNDPEAAKWLTQLDDTIRRVMDNGESYQNYIDNELKNDYLDRFYGSNLKKLVEVKNKIDPGNYFQFPQSIPLAVPAE